MSKKILVVLTGGTIGSVINNNTINVEDRSCYDLLKKYQEKWGLDDDFKFIVEQPYNTLSENITLDIWTQLCSYLNRINFSDYDGIIITHGSDTYSYTASLLGILFNKCLSIPMVLVASNYAIDVLGSNGLSNFRNAVCYIKQKYKEKQEKIDLHEPEQHYEVVCIYKNRIGRDIVYRGVEITEADTCIDEFGTYGGEIFGTIENEIFVKNKNHLNHCESDIYISNRDIKFTNEIMVVKTVPGLNYNYINLNYNQQRYGHQLGAVLINLYHSATACIMGTDESFLHFALKCKNSGIPLYACGFKKHVKDKYETLQLIEQANINKLYDMSPEAAYSNVLIEINANV